MFNQKKQAVEWAQKVMSEPDKHSPDTRVAAEHILSTDRLTMADVEWDDASHFLAEATYTAGRVSAAAVMVGPTLDEKIYCINMLDYTAFWLPPEALTPTGERYALEKVTEIKTPRAPRWGW